MNDYQKFYVYAHIDPDTEEILYIGIGTSCRAFRATGSGHREGDHSDWLNGVYERGIIPVRFLDSGLRKEKALELEKQLIIKYKPKFNKLLNPDYKAPKKFSVQTINFIKKLRDMGYSYTKIAFLVGGESPVSRKNKKAMSIWRIIND